MSGEETVYRTHQRNEEEAVSALWEASFNRTMSPAFIRWLHVDTVSSRLDSSAALIEGKLVGFVGGTPAVFLDRGTRLPVTRSQNGMVDPGYRRRGIFTGVVQRFDRQAVENGLRFVYGFPNDQSFPAMVGLCDYVHVGDLPELRAPATPLVREGAVTFGPPEFSEADAALFGRFVPEGLLRNVRDLTHLRWRYAAHPTKEYTVARLGEEGLAVFKLFADDRTADLCELCCAPERLPDLLGGVAREAASRGAESLSVWSLPHFPLHDALTALGFVPTGRGTHYIAKWYAEPTRDDWTGLDAWYLTFGDSDVY